MDIGDAEFCGCEVEHSDEIVGGTEPSGLSFDGREDAVEGFEERVGRFVPPVSEDSFEVTLDLPAHLTI